MLRRILTVAVSLAVTAVPAVLGDPAVRNFVANHPAVAAWYPLATGIVYALYRAFRTRAAGDVVASSGSETMKAAD